MHRFFVDYPVKNKIQIIEKDDIRHISKVLRLSVGEQIEIVDSQFRLFVCELIQIDSEGVFCVPIYEQQDTGESPINITLYQGVPKGEKFDLIIQKSIELGVTRIVPVLFDRCVVKFKDDKSIVKKHTRWNRIAYEAAKQSKRCYVPEVAMPITVTQLEDEIKSSSERLDILFYEEEDSVGLKEEFNHFKDRIKLKNGESGVVVKKLTTVDETRDSKKNILKLSVSAIVGAEGGLEPYEVQKLKNSGAKCVSLGKRILRTETAGIITVALIQYELGDLGNA